MTSAACVVYRQEITSGSIDPVACGNETIDPGDARRRWWRGGVLVALCLLLMTSLPRPCLAGPFEDAFALLKSGDLTTGLTQMRALAAQGNADAQDVLGYAYHFGRGVPKDYAEAVKWYRMAAELGRAESQVHLGMMYLGGLGVTKDAAEAARWFRRAAGSAPPFHVGSRSRAC